MGIYMDILNTIRKQHEQFIKPEVKTKDKQRRTTPCLYFELPLLLLGSPNKRWGCFFQAITPRNHAVHAAFRDEYVKSDAKKDQKRLANILKN